MDVRTCSAVTPEEQPRQVAYVVLAVAGAALAGSGDRGRRAEAGEH